MESEQTVETEDMTRAEVVTAAARNANFYGRFFFKKTMRQDTPQMHLEIDDALDRPENNRVAIESFRGSAKTSKLRVFTSKRIAFGYSRTILFISDTENHASKSIEWIARNVEHNRLWADTFKLKKGNKWSGTELDIVNELAECTIRIIALGITGQIRGLNIDDYRPDLIVVDDPENEENTATPEQRKKISSLFFGAVEKSLVPPSENPNSKLVVLQTPLHRDALIEVLRKSPNWESRRYGCFGPDGESRWPTRFPTEELLKDKAAHAARNQMSLWMREMECKVVAEETSTFRGEWLRYWDTIPEGAVYYMSIDPAPPPRGDAPISENSRNDDQVLMIIAVYGPKAYIVEYWAEKNKNPEQLAVEFFRLFLKYNPQWVAVESVNYQRVLAWFLRKAMEARNIFAPVREVQDRRKKSDRIRQAYVGRASQGNLHVHRSHTKFIQQFCDYPDVSYDDVIDAGAIALDLAAPHSGVGSAGTLGQSIDLSRLRDNWRQAP